MFSYRFTNIQSISTIDLNESIIWVLNAHKTPPHIGISTGKHYFSLKANGKDEAVHSSKMIELIERKKIPAILVQLNIRLTEDELRNGFAKYTKAGENDATCLSPIAAITLQPESKQLATLLKNLEHCIQQIGGINLPKNYSSLPEYDMQTIRQHIEELTVYVGE